MFYPGRHETPPGNAIITKERRAAHSQEVSVHFKLRVLFQDTEMDGGRRSGRRGCSQDDAAEGLFGGNEDGGGKGKEAKGSLGTYLDVQQGRSLKLL